MEMNKKTASEIFCWIGNLENALEDLQGAVTEFFAKDSEETRMSMLKLIIGQQQLWGGRPQEEINKLLDARDQE